MDVNRLTSPVIVLLVCVIGALFAASCGGGDAPEATATVEPVPATLPPTPVCLEGTGFVQEGALVASPIVPGDATSIGGLRWARHEGCERFVIDLVRQDGSPADRPGRVTASFLRDDGVVRVQLDSKVVTTGKTPQEMAEALAPKSALLGGELAERAFIVRSDRMTGGSLFVDLHLAAPAEARIITLASPARVVVDLKPGGRQIGRPFQHLLGSTDPSGVVVLTPQGPTSSYPLQITGYARNFEANIIAEVRQGGQRVEVVNGIATDWIEAWGLFTLTIESGPSGFIDLFVGDYAARDGAEEGVHIPLTMR